MVFQQFACCRGAPLKKTWALVWSWQVCPRPSASSGCSEQLELVGLDQWADRYAHELSGGMQQRVGLARAFATEAPILLMDEPFSALDPLIRTHLQDELLKLQSELKRTIIFVSHDLDEALKIGNRIAIMQDGRIVQAGTPQDIVLKPGERLCGGVRAAHEPAQRDDR
jgi:glycine betaine/proline transport system ATP-binding protein